MIFLGVLFSFRSLAQTVPVGLPVLDESLRNLQLEGKLDPKYSLSSRPFFTDKILTTDSLYKLMDSKHPIKTCRTHLFGNKGVFELLPFSFENQFNSHNPYGWNNAPMIDARGYQTFVSTGFYASLGIFSVQFKPEAVYAANPNFDYSSQYGAPTKGPYHHFFTGQSSIRINAAGLSFGVSTENMWWGPGIQNSLLMSNNAPGFAHLTLNTTKPIKTPIGNFEFQLIAGKLTEDTSVLLENKDLTTFYYTQGNYFGLPGTPSSDSLSWRYLNGITISYNPKWIKNLFLGITRVAYTYHNYLGEHQGFIHTYLPVFIGLFRNDAAYSSGSLNLKQIISINARYLFLKLHAELYAEYGANDNTYNLRDLLMSPDHAAAFTVGFKKIYALRNSKRIDINAEIIQLAESIDQSIRPTTGYWYLFQGGYTNQSKIIGSGFGMGSNMQTLTASLIEGLNKYGIIFQRIAHDPNPNYLNGLPSVTVGSRDYPWNDLSAGLIFQKKMHRLLLNASLQAISSTNYAWKKNDNPINIHGQLTMQYYW